MSGTRWTEPGQGAPVGLSCSKCGTKHSFDSYGNPTKADQSFVCSRCSLVQANTSGKKACWKCRGTGQFANLGTCWACNGRGTGEPLTAEDERARIGTAQVLIARAILSLDAPHAVEGK